MRRAETLVAVYVSNAVGVEPLGVYQLLLRHFHAQNRNVLFVIGQGRSCIIRKPHTNLIVTGRSICRNFCFYPNGFVFLLFQLDRFVFRHSQAIRKLAGFWREIVAIQLHLLRVADIFGGNILNRADRYGQRRRNRGMNPDIAGFIGKIGDLKGGMLAAQSSHFQAFRFGRRIFIFKGLDKGGQDAGLDVHVFLLFDCGFFQQFIAPEIRFDFTFPDKLTRRHSDNAAECAEEERVVIETGKFADLGQVVIPVTDQALRAVDLVLRAEVRYRGADQTVEQLRIIVFAVVEVCGNVLKRNLGRIDSADIVEHFFQEPVRLRLVRAGAGVTRNAEQREQPEDIRRKERGVVCIFRSHELGKDFLHFLILSGGEEARIYFFTGENCGQPVCQLLAGEL